MVRKHALIITAYQEIDFLIELLQIYSKYFRCYVHIDKKAKLKNSELEAIQGIVNVKVIQKYKINWGSYKHILAVTELIQMALHDECDYFSVISANMFPVKNPQKIIGFFNRNEDSIFMEVQERSKMEPQKAFYAFDYRYKAFFFQHIYNLRSKNVILRRINGILEEKMANVQMKWHIRNNVLFEYKGYIYCHFPKLAACYLLNYLKNNPKYIRKLKYCYVGEEFFFQNIWKNSVWKNRVIKDPKVFDIWSEERGWPAFLELDDFEEIVNSNCLFARKLNKTNINLWEKIREYEGF